MSLQTTGWMRSIECQGIGRLSARHHRSLAILLATLFLAAISTSVSQAVPIFYGDFPAATVDYLGVFEDANSVDDSPPLFGAPIVAGNSLDFTPIGFNAAAAGAGGNDITDGQLGFMIMAHAGHGIPQIGFSESGDTFLSGFDLNGATAPNTLTKVTAEVFIEILEVDGVQLLAPINYQDELVFTPFNGEYELHDEGGGGPFYQTNWAGSLLISLNSILDANFIPYNLGVTKVTVNLDNTLLAVTQEGTQAFIAKKDFDALSITVVPEPASLVLFGLGLVGCLAYRRKG